MKGGLQSEWNTFFFAPVDARVYAMLRVGIAFVIVVYLAVLGPDWLRWFSETGVLPRDAAARNIDPDTWSLFNLLPASPAVLWTIYGLIWIHAVLLFLGIKCRLQVVCLFLWIVSLHHRNNLIWEGGDVLLRITLFLMIWMPLAVKTGSATRWPLRLLQLQQSVLYFSAVMRKLQGSDWTTGVALYYTSRLEDFSGRLLGFPIPARHLWISEAGSWFALAVEMLLVFAVWVPSMRKAAVITGIAFHLLLELSMNLFVFQWLMILILASHLPACFAGHIPGLGKPIR